MVPKPVKSTNATPLIGGKPPLVSGGQPTPGASKPPQVQKLKSLQNGGQGPTPAGKKTSRSNSFKT